MKVFINPGHSENCKPDPGASYNGYKEATIAREIGNALVDILKAHSVEVELYQQRNEENESLTANQQLNRVSAKANSSKADIFISIHLNASTGTSAKGTETLYNKNSRDGEKLAYLINESLTKPFVTYTFVNRGAKADIRNLLVLRASKMPAVLVEVGFISNTLEVSFIKNNIYNVAKRIAEGILQYFSITNIPTKQNNKILLEENDKGLYNCYINDVLKLKNNKLSTCLNWIEKNV